MHTSRSHASIRCILRTFSAVLVAAVLLVLVQPASAQVTILHCTFDDAPLDQIVPNGGPSAGQPIYLDRIDAYVRSTPLPTPSVEIADHWGNGARYLNFAFLHYWEITAGQLRLEFELWFTTIGNYSIALKDFLNVSPGFIRIYFNQFGNVIYQDSDTPGAQTIGTYSPGFAQRWVIDIDLDAGTYDLSMGTLSLLSGESLGAGPHAFGRILVGHSSDSDTFGEFHLGELLATATDVPVGTQPESVGTLKARYRSIRE